MNLSICQLCHYPTGIYFSMPDIYTILLVYASIYTDIESYTEISSIWSARILMFSSPLLVHFSYVFHTCLGYSLYRCSEITRIRCAFSKSKVDVERHVIGCITTGRQYIGIYCAKSSKSRKSIKIITVN